MEYRELAHESGIAAWGRVPALNTNATFINDLADLVLEKLPSTALRLGAASPAGEDHNLGPPSGAAAARRPRPALGSGSAGGRAGCSRAAPSLGRPPVRAVERAVVRLATGLRLLLTCHALSGLPGSFVEVGPAAAYSHPACTIIRLLRLSRERRSRARPARARRARGRAAAGVRPRAARAAAAGAHVAVGLDQERGDLERPHRCARARCPPAPALSAPRPTPDCAEVCGLGVRRAACSAHARGARRSCRSTW